MNINEISDKKITYLQMIQGTIDRMSTASAIFKGFSATIVTGVSVITFSNVNNWILIMSFVPLLIFWILDIYYLRLERRYRFLYERVRTSEGEPDFVLTPPEINTIKSFGKEAAEKVSIGSCMKSPSIALFYIPMVVICVIVVILKCSGCLGQ